MSLATDNPLLPFAIRAFVTLFAVIDPLGNVPFFLSAAQGLNRRQQRAVALRVSVVAAGVLGLFALAGSLVLAAFALTLPAVRIAAGIVLLVIALHMLLGWQFQWQREHPAVPPGEAAPAPGIVPLAIPLMAGPGAMSSVIALTSPSGGASHLAAVLAAVGAVCAISFACFELAGWVTRRLGRSFIVTLSSLMGLILAALAVQFTLDGLREALPGLFAPPGALPAPP